MHIGDTKLQPETLVHIQYHGIHQLLNIYSNKEIEIFQRDVVEKIFQILRVRLKFNICKAMKIRKLVKFNVLNSEFELVTCEFELVTRNSQLVTRVLLFPRIQCPYSILLVKGRQLRTSGSLNFSFKRTPQLLQKSNSTLSTFFSNVFNCRDVTVKNQYH